VLWFVVVVILMLPDGTVVTVAREVEGRLECDELKSELKTKHPDKYRGSTCTRYTKDGNGG
jgi:hypothetical protein